MDDASTIRQEGERSYFELKGRYSNPYPGNTPEYNHFERGWSQALRKNDARLIEYPQQFKEPAPVSPAPEIPNLYAQVKGRSKK